jgi:hypothetical protein
LNFLIRYLKVILILQLLNFPIGGRLTAEHQNTSQKKSFRQGLEVKPAVLAQEPQDEDAAKKRQYKPKGTQVPFLNVTLYEYRKFSAPKEFVLNCLSVKTQQRIHYSPGKRGPPAFHLHS